MIENSSKERTELGQSDTSASPSLKALTQEATRNLRHGASRSLLLTGAILLALIAFVGSDTTAIVALTQEAHEFRDSGSDIWIIDSELGEIDAHSCTDLTVLPGIQGAFAVRPEANITATHTPSTSIKSYAIFGDPTSVFVRNQRPAQHVDSFTNMADGSGLVYLSQVASGQIGRTGGDTFIINASGLLDSQEVKVEDVFTFPDSASDATLAASALFPTTVGRDFTQCYLRMWPYSSELLSTATIHVGKGSERIAPIGNQQLVTENGVSFDAASAYSSRFTQCNWVLFPLFMTMIGFFWARIRRIDSTLSLQANCPKLSLWYQYCLEAMPSVIIAALIASTAGAIYTTITLPLLRPWPLAHTLLIPGLTGLASLLLGIGIQISILRTTRLYQLFKNR